MALPRDPSTPTTQQPPRPASNSGSPAATTAPRTTPAAASRSAAPAKKATAPARSTGAPQTSGAKFTVDSFMAALRAQESGGDYGNHHGGGTASGAYQYIDSTWNGYGGYAHAWQAPKAVQDARARADITAALRKYGGDWEKVAAAHFAGAGWVAAHPDKSTWGVNPVPGSQNPTVSQYVSSLFGKSGVKTTDSNTGGGTYATSQQVYDNVAGQYGYLAAFLNDKELGPILQRAAKEGWDSDRLQGAIYKTHWYQNHAATTREFDAQSKLDPATQRRDIQRRVVDIQTQARHSGITLDGSTLAKLATQSLRFGWSDQELTNAIVAQGKMDITGKTPGGASATAAQLKEQAAQYMVPVSDGQLMKWVKDIETGNLAVGDFTGYLKEQAKSLFPGLSAAIDRGVTVEQYADPYRQQAAQILEVDPQSIDFMKDPKYRPALFQIDPKTKDRTSMSLADWDTYLRKTPDYAKTHQANQQAAAFGNTLLQTFGAIST